MTIHVLPVNDAKLHTQETSCPCGTSAEAVDGNLLVVHDAFDGREKVEQVAGELNIPLPDESPGWVKVNQDGEILE